VTLVVLPMFAGYVIFALLGKAEEYKEAVISCGRTNADKCADKTGRGEAFESLSITRYFLLV
jgi:hypothetical protein